MRYGKRFALSLLCITVLHGIAPFAGFFAPYDYAEQNRNLPYVPPSKIHFRDAQGTFHWRPCICLPKERQGTFGVYDEDRGNCFPVHFLVRGTRYRVLGVLQFTTHLFGVSSPGKIFVLGSDGYGRDELSRLLYGTCLSLFSGSLATALTLGLGMLLGTIAGYFGGWWDAIIMRLVELFLALPWLYLLLGIRALLPLHIDPSQAFLLLIAVIGVVGWARPARIIRGIALSERERGYVLAARMFGASDAYVMRRHIAPSTYGVLLTQAALLAPQYIAAEVTLSFLGLGVTEPVPTWGNMLSVLQQYDVLVSYWWMWAPAVALILVGTMYWRLASALQTSEVTAH